jgi:hypothetical protein
MLAKSRLLAVLVALATLIPGTAYATTASANVVCPRIISIADHRQLEGTKAIGSAPVAFTFTVTSSGCAIPGSIYFTTLPIRATDHDYRVTSGILTFAAGDKSARTITVGVVADQTGELNEDFSVHLCHDTGFINFQRQAATGYILNDDGIPTEISDPLGPNFHCSE